MPAGEPRVRAPEVRDLAEDMVAAGCRTLYPSQLANDAGVQLREALSELEYMVSRSLLIRRDDPDMGEEYQPTDVFIGKALRHGRLVMGRDLLWFKIVGSMLFAATLATLVIAIVALGHADQNRSAPAGPADSAPALARKLRLLTQRVTALEGTSEITVAQFATIRTQLSDIKSEAGSSQSSANQANSAIGGLGSRTTVLENRLGALEQSLAAGNNKTSTTTTSGSTGHR